MWLLTPLLRKKSPVSGISRTGEEGKKQNCYTIYLISNNRRHLIIEGIDSYGVHGKQYDGNMFANDASVTFEQFKAIDVEVVHYYGLDTVTYKGLFSFFITGKTKIEYIIIHFRRLLFKCSQFIFDRRKLVTVQRLQLLRILVDNYIEKAGRGIGLIELMTKLYSIKWVEHPAGDSQEQKISLYLDSLVASGELTKNITEYSVTPKAILTIEKYEEAERRHKNQIRLQFLMVILTFLLAFFAMIQAQIIKFPWSWNLKDLFGI
jgi:hypothetical protein